MLIGANTPIGDTESRFPDANLIGIWWWALRYLVVGVTTLVLKREQSYTERYR